MLTLLTVYFLGGLLLTILALPLIFRKIKPNPFYGFRVAKTFSDPVVWYAANHYAGRQLFFSGLLIMIFSLGLYLIPGLTLDNYAWACLAATLGCLGLALFLSFRYLNRIGK